MALARVCFGDEQAGCGLARIESAEGAQGEDQLGLDRDVLVATYKEHVQQVVVLGARSLEVGLGGCAERLVTSASTSIPEVRVVGHSMQPGKRGLREAIT